MFSHNKSWKRENMNLSACANSNTNTKNAGVKCHMSHFTCSVSPAQPQPLLTPPIYTVYWFSKTKNVLFFNGDDLGSFLSKNAHSKTRLYSSKLS